MSEPSRAAVFRLSRDGSRMVAWAVPDPQHDRQAGGSGGS